MTQQDRLNRVLELVAARGSISIAEASEALGVSPATVRRDLSAARDALARQREGDAPASVQDAYLPVVILGVYERQVLQASTWPFNLAIVGRVFASAVAPLAVYLVKLAFGVGGLP